MTLIPAPILFDELERAVIALGKRDHVSRIGPRGQAIARLFGVATPNALAAPRLEALRLLVIALLIFFVVTQPVAAALHYEATGAYFAYNLRFNADSTITLAWGGKITEHVRLHLLLPAGVSPRQASLNGSPLPFTTSKIEGSTYLDATLPGLGQLEIR